MNKRMIIVIAVVIGAVLGYYFLMPSEHQQMALVRCYLKDIYIFVQNHYWVSVVLFLLLMIIANLCMLPVAILLSLIAGYIYGVTWGALYVIIATLIGGLCTVVLVRYYGNHFFDVERLRAQGVFAQINDQLNKRGVWFIAIANGIPFMPTSLINIVVGFSQISLLSYATATMIGLIPATLVYTVAGRKLYTLDASNIFLNKWLLWGVGILLCALVMHSFFKKRL